MKKFLSCILACLLVMQFGIIAFASENEDAQPYTARQDFVGEDSLNGITDAAVSTYFTDIKEENDLEVAAATVQTVYVIETQDEAGHITDSRLMNAEEVAKYEKMRSSQSPISTLANTWIGDDSERHTGGKLSLYLVVYRDSSKNYLAYGTASWDSGSNGAAVGNDFIAITWGGGGELKRADYSISGEYQTSKKSISFSRANSDTYSGYCWQFDELYGGYSANYIDCYVKLSKTYTATRNKETGIKLTYIHTYQSVVGSVSFSVNSSADVAAGVSLSSCDKQWQIEIDVGGITY